MKLIGVLAAAAAALTLSAAFAQESSKSTASPATRACFNFDQVTSFKSVDADTIRIETSKSKAFNLDLTGPKCGPLDQAGQWSIKSAPAFTICTGELVKGRVTFHSPAIAQRMVCTISKVALGESEPQKTKELKKVKEPKKDQ